jgi:DNA-binding beta-propeller fold protein YncE
VNQNYATEFLVFAAASPDTAMATAELDEMTRRLGRSQPLSIAYDNESQQPFFWYLRGRDNVHFFTGTSGLTGDPHVVLIGPDNESKLKSQLLGKYTRRDYRLIWWPDESVYRNLSLSKLWQDLRDPARRKYWWDILWFRKYPQSTTAWPLVHKFAMYVRKDLSAQTWVLGAGVSEPAIGLPEDAYEKQRRDLAAAATWGSYGEGAGQFNYPKGIAVDGHGNVVVADSYNHRVQVFDKDGGFVRQWGGAGSAPGLFQEPWGIAVDDADRIYVADTWNHRVQVFDSEGGFLRQWGFFGDTSGTLADPNQFYGPRDVVVDSAGNVLVSDTGNKRVVKFTAEGQFLQQTGGAGSLNGQFREPVGLAADVDGNVYVADTWNHRIQKFDANLSYLSEWPVVGWEGEGVTNKPYLSSDRDGSVYASAPDVHWVTAFSSTGAVRAVWGKYGADLNSMNMPTGVATDAAGNVYVLDSANHRVLKFAPLR